MRHRMGGRKLGMPSDQRRALLRSLVSSVLWYDEVITTEARAKEASRIIDRIITLAKKNDLHARRLVQGMIFEQSIPFQGSSEKSHGDIRNQHRLLRRIFQDLGPLYRDIRGGYARIIRIGPRRGDAAMMVRLELTKGISVGRKTGSRKSVAQPRERPVADASRVEAGVTPAALAPPAVEVAA